MAAAKKCKACGAVVQPNAPFGQCPKCLVLLALGPVAKESPAQDASDGRTRFVGDYELLEQIGRGGMAVVYKARQLALHRIVALKMILAGEFASPASVHRFQIEAEAAAKLDHPNIVPIYDIGVHHGHHYFTMKLVEGRSLAREIREAPSEGETRAIPQGPPRQRHLTVASLMTKVARAVEYAHQRGVIHRDLKPGNILLDGQGEPHLTDFGLAKILEHEIGMTMTAEVMGTPGYMAPEQAAGGKSEAAADIYSLGAILFEALTGRPPFAAPTIAETLRQVTSEEAPDPRSFDKSIDRDLSTVVLKCLEKEPSHRYCSARELADDLERWQRHEPVSARRATVMARGGRWLQRNPLPAALIGTLCFALAASLILLKKSKEEERAKQYALTIFKRSLSGYIHQLGKPAAEVVEIGSEQLRVMSGRPPQLSHNPARFGVGVLMGANAMETILGYAGMFAQLEQSLSSRLGTAVRLDLKLYLNDALAREELVKGHIAFGRFDQRLYLQAKDSTKVLLLARENEKQYPAMIFTRSDSGITNLAGLAGKSLLFWDKDSITTLNAKTILYENGICRRKVRCEMLPSEDALSTVAGRIDGSHESYFDRESPVVHQVLKLKKYDAGIAIERQLRRYGEDEWVVLAKFDVPRAVWVAGPSLKEKQLQVIREALLEWSPTKDGQERHRYGYGFQVRLAKGDDQNCDNLRMAMQRSQEFDECAEVPLTSAAASNVPASDRDL